MAAWFGAVLASAPAHASPNPAGAWLSVSAQYRSGTFVREWSGFLSLNIPFDRLAAPRVEPGARSLREEPNKRSAEPRPAPTPAPAPGPRPTPVPAPVPAAMPAPAPPSNGSTALERPLVPELGARLSSQLARGAVHHALASAGYLRDRSRLSGLAARARRSAVLPELRLRTEHSAGQTLRLAPTSEDPYRYTQAGTSELALEARLTWHLDRLVFAGEEVALERLQRERDAAERRLIEYVLERLLVWQRGRMRAQNPDLEPEARDSAELEALGAAIELDVLTDGWFSQAIAESAAGEASAAGESPKVEVNSARHAR